MNGLLYISKKRFSSIPTNLRQWGQMEGGNSNAMIGPRRRSSWQVWCWKLWTWRGWNKLVPYFLVKTWKTPMFEDWWVLPVWENAVANISSLSAWWSWYSKRLSRSYLSALHETHSKRLTSTSQFKRPDSRSWWEMQNGLLPDKFCKHLGHSERVCFFSSNILE